MADKTSDPYYARLESLIDKVLKVGELMPFEKMLGAFVEHPERMGGLIMALYRARYISSPTGGLINPAQMSDSQLEDALALMSERIANPPSQAAPDPDVINFNEAERRGRDRRNGRGPAEAEPQVDTIFEAPEFDQEDDEARVG